MRQPVDWNLIASVQAVLATGSLSAAARSLGVTQPTIRRHIDELEGALGIALFTRSSTGLTPTALARDIAPYADEIHALVAALVRGASADREGLSGTLRVASSEIMASEVLPALLAPFLNDNPGIDIELVASNRVENLLRREADVAVRMVRPDQVGLAGRKVAAIELGLYAASSYVERKGVPADIDALVRDHEMVGEDRNTALVDALEKLMPEARAIRFRYRSDSHVAQLAAVRAGAGIGVCQCPVARQEARLRRVLPGFATFLDVWLVTHEDLREHRRIRALLDHLGGALSAFAAR